MATEQEEITALARRIAFNRRALEQARQERNPWQELQRASFLHGAEVVLRLWPAARRAHLERAIMEAMHLPAAVFLSLIAAGWVPPSDDDDEPGAG